MPNGEEFSQGYWVVVLVGLAKLVDMSTGSNNEIINMSEYYRFNMLMMLGLAGLAVTTNWLLIPRMGMEGAALATLLTIVVFNAAKLIFIYYKYRLLPFTRKNLWLLAVTAGVLYLALRISAARVGVARPSAALVGHHGRCSGTLVFLLRISEDANHLFSVVLRRIGWYNNNSSD